LKHLQGFTTTHKYSESTNT